MQQQTAEIISLENVSFQYDEASRPVFTDLNLKLYSGVTSLVGQNGTGKTSLLLLAGARLMPDSGRIFLNGRDTREFRDEESRNLIVSFIYQNMEFETEEPVGGLFEQIHAGGAHANESSSLVGELISVFELEHETTKKTQQLSKGALQRTIIVFSLLYGSPVVMMDEPFFALEQRQKEKALDYICDYARRRGTSFFYSAHELPLTRRYSDRVLLFDKQGGIEQGEPDALLTGERLEAAYGIPAAMLKEKESLHRQHLTEIAAQIRAEE